MSDLVSVIITTCKRSPEIVIRAINSVCSQTYSNVEIIVVDDSPSTYEHRLELQEQLSKFEDKVKYIAHQRNRGACVARNTGLNSANGNYVAFLDDDDEWIPQKLEEQLKRFKDDKTALVYCKRITVNDSNEITLYDDAEINVGYVYDKLIYNNFIGSTSIPLIKRECLMEIGGFDPLMMSAQDYDVWLRLAEKYKIDYVDSYLVKYHIHNDERISTNGDARRSGQERLIQKNIGYLRKCPRAWWWRLMRLSLQYSRNMQLKNALQIWMDGYSKNRLSVFTNFRYLFYIFILYFKEKYF